MYEKRFNTQIIDQILRYNGLTQFTKQTKEDLERLRIKYNECLDRVGFRKKIYDTKTLQNRNKSEGPNESEMGKK